MTLDEWREIQKPLMKKFILTQKALAQNFINDSLKDEEKLNKELACTRQSAVIVGSFIFVHGGIVPALAKQYKVSQVNNLIRKWLLKKIDDNNSDIDTLINTPQVSPFWTRLFGHLPSGLKKSNSRCKDINEVLKIWGEDTEGLKGLKGMVVGHTPQIDKGINSTCDKSVWRVDLGASKAFDVFDRIKNSGRKPAVLEIVNDGEEFNILSQFLQNKLKIYFIKII